MSEEQACRVEGAWKIYAQKSVEVQALRGIDLSIPAGEMVAITGPSGSGKSTLLHILGALTPPTRGRAIILGQDLTSLDDESLAAFRRRRLGFVFQFFNLLPTLSARENVLLPSLLDGVPRRQAAPLADRLLDRVGLAERRDHRPDELSGGQQQRVALARALIAAPALLLADEPTGNLDSNASAAVLDLLDELQRERQFTVVLVTHDERVASRAARRIHLVDGALAWDRPQNAPRGRSPAMEPAREQA